MEEIFGNILTDCYPPMWTSGRIKLRRNVGNAVLKSCFSLQDLEEFVNGSGDDGFIVFTLGSMVENMPVEKAKEFFTAFGQIPQRVTNDGITSHHDCFLPPLALGEVPIKHLQSDNLVR